MLEFLVIFLFVSLIVYFVVSLLIILRYRKMKKLNAYLMNRYLILNRKSYVLDRCLSLYNLDKVELNEVNKSFFSLYKDLLDIDSYLNKE